MMKKRHKFLIGLSISAAIFGFLAIGSALFRFFTNNPAKIIDKSSEVLIITIRSSGGHMSAAKALQGKLKKRGCKTDLAVFDDYDPLMMGPMYENLMSSQYGRMAMSSLITKTYWNVGSYYPPLFTEFFKQWLMRGNYKCIVSVWPAAYKLVDYTLKHNNYNIPFVIIPTDWEDPSHGAGYWIDGPNALYILGTERLWNQCPSEYNKKRVDGMILREEFTQDVKSKAERRKELGLPSNKPLVMVIFGKCASSDMVKTALLMRNCKEYHFVFLCGSNEQIRDSINSIKNEFECKHYTVYGLLDCPHKVMQACDIFVGKPGPGAMSEAMCYDMPILYSKNGMLLQEIYNGKWVESMEIGTSFTDPAELVKLLPTVLQNLDKYQQAYQKIKKNNALNQICEILETICKGNTNLPEEKDAVKPKELPIPDTVIAT